MNQRTEDILERIALALECIADRLQSLGMDQSAAGFVPSFDDACHAVLEPPPPEPLSDRIDDIPALLESFLNQRGVAIKVVPALDAADRVIDSLSLFLGEHYVSLSSLLRKIKRAMQTGASVTESLAGKPQVDVNAACQFCHRLHEVAFLEQYKYFRAPRYLIRAKTTTLPKAQRFFGGQWLERFVLEKVKQVHSQIAMELESSVRLEYLVNPQITLPNGDDFELDVLAGIGGTIYWIEAKTGFYQQYVSKYSKVARILGFDYDHSIMVLPDVALSTCDALSSMFSMTVCNLGSFQEHLRNLATKDCLGERFLTQR